MKKLWLLWFAFAVGLFLMFGVALNFEVYINHLTSTLPTFQELYNDLVTSFNSFTNLTFGNEVQSLKDLFNIISSFFTMIWQVLLLPIKLIVWIVKVFIAILPINSFNTI